MSKATRNRTRAAQERIAAQREAARRAERRRVMLISGGSIIAVIAIVVVFVFFALNRKQAGSGHLPNSVASQITGVPATTLASVGTGTSASASSVYLKAITDNPLTSGGKPQMLFIGAEYCPYCAAMRWSMAVALGRFGTFGPLKGIHSSAHDVYPNTPTLTFYKQQYSSSYLTFTPIENEDINHNILQPVSKAELALWTKYDSTAQGVGYPFIDFGGKVILTGPLYIPTLLHGLSWSQIAGQLSNPNSTVAKNIDGAANYITAAICKMTSNAPASVCNAGPIPTIEAKL
jgi:thiol-disulfide isomerase/thioredoxin